jgi:co-chaperonin GroES (HSP10)
MVITQKDIKTKYEWIEPVNGNVLAQFTEKEEDIKVGSIILPSSGEMNEAIARNYLVIEKVSKEAQEKFPTLEKGDVVEVLNARDIQYFFGHAKEKMVLFNCSSIAGIYKKKGA